MQNVRVTVSGHSAGASAAIQHLVAFSGSVDGAAIAAGSPYGCGQQLYRYQTCFWGGLSDHAAVRYVRRRWAQRLIDDPKKLRHTPVLLFSGAADIVVLTSVMRSVEAQLRTFVDAEHIETHFETGCSHTWSVDHGQCHCGACALWNVTKEVRPPCCDVNNCGYDLSGSLLRHFYGASSLKPRTAVRSEGLKWVDQWAYVPGPIPPQSSTMLRWAFAYVPAACDGPTLVRGCRVHVNYHGCTPLPTSNTSEGWSERLRWQRSIDLNAYAEANRIVVLYPQTAGSESIGVGCFNWASYEDDPLFDTKRGVQLSTVVSLVNDLPNALYGNRTARRGPDGLVGGLEG